MNLEVWQWIAALSVTLLAAVVQGSIGFGYAMLSVPVLSLIDTRFAPVPQILSALPLTVWAACREWSAVDWKGAWWVLIGRVPGLALGALLLVVSTPRVISALIGGFVLLAVVVLSTDRSFKRSAAIDFGAGAVATVSGYVSGIGGPPIALLFREARGPTLRSTLGVIFTVGVVMTIFGRLSTGHVTRLDAMLGQNLDGLGD